MVKASLVELKPLAPPPGALPPRYDTNARCEYHANSPGHTLEKCWAFKHKVQDLLEAQDITFEKPNVKSNPMPPHGGPTINAIEVVTDFGAGRQAKSPIRLLKEYLLECGFLLEHNEAFEKTLQQLVDQGIVQFGPYPEAKYIAAIEGSTKKPLVIPYHDKKTLVIPWRDSTEKPVKQTLKILVASKATMVIKGPSPIPYKSDKEVPWSYDSTVYVNGSKQECEPSSGREPAISNIAGTGGITRSGRVFGNKPLEKNTNVPKNKSDLVTK